MTRDEFQSWQEWSITREIFTYLKRRQDGALQKMIDYGFGNNTDEIALGCARNAGIVAGLNEVLELEYDDLHEDIRKGEL